MDYLAEEDACRSDREIVHKATLINFNQFEGFCLWEINEFEEYGDEKYREEMYQDMVEGFDMRRLVPSSLYHLLEDTEFLDICYIAKGTESLQEEELEPDSYPNAVYQCKRLLNEYFANSAVEKNKQAERIWELVKSERSVREKLKQEDICVIARMSLELPARVIVYLTCELNKKRFWSVWKELRNVAYTDEKMPQYKSSKFIAERAAAAHKPVSQIGTAKFLCQYDSSICRNTSKELKDEEECYLPDDDRAFWWDGSEEVVFSNQMQKWLLRLAKRHKKLVKEIKDNKRNKGDFLKELVCLLADINVYYKRVFPFQNMFYEFLQNGDDKRYIAAVRLLEEVSRENMEKGKIIEKVTDPHREVLTVIDICQQKLV